MRFKKDKQVMAELLDLEYKDMQALSTVENENGTTVINCYERDFRTGQRGHKTITLKRKK
jgi:hypothetical protein